MQCAFHEWNNVISCVRMCMCAHEAIYQSIETKFKRFPAKSPQFNRKTSLVHFVAYDHSFGKRYGYQNSLIVLIKADYSNISVSFVFFYWNSGGSLIWKSYLTIDSQIVFIPISPIFRCVMFSMHDVSCLLFLTSACFPSRVEIGRWLREKN